MAKYDLQIELLERLIHNWYDIKTPSDFYNVFPEYRNVYIHRDGLCAVCRLGFMNRLDRYYMFRKWSLYNRDLVYPVGGFNEFFGILLTTDNPKRLHLAVHCLQWLRQRNIEEV